MSLQTDIIFVKALRVTPNSSSGLPAGRCVQHRHRAARMKKAENAPLLSSFPLMDLNNQDTTKDDAFESEETACR